MPSSLSGRGYPRRQRQRTLAEATTIPMMADALWVAEALEPSEVEVDPVGSRLIG